MDDVAFDRLSRRVVQRGRALGEGGRHDDVLGRADARELEHDVVAEQPGVGHRVQVVVAEGEAGAQRLQPLEVHVDRSRPEVVPAREGEPHPATSSQQAPFVTM